jgi:protease-4
MNNFFKTVFASMLGCLFTTIIIIIFFIFVIGGIISSSSKDKKIEIKSGSILHIKLDHPVLERSSNNPFNDFDFSTMKSSQSIGLRDIINAIRKAADDDKISGIFIEPAPFMPGFSTMEEIRTALIDFKDQGKFIIAYADMYSQKAYYLSSIADEVYLNPQGMVDFRGLASQLFFLKGTFDKLQIETQALRHGKYKSAIEPFTLDKMSEENKAQYLSFLNSIWEKYKHDISKSRNIHIDTLDMYANKFYLRNASDALQYGFVDGLIYKDEILEILKQKVESDKDINKLETVSLYKYVRSSPKAEKKQSKDKIAVIYATGEIGIGKGSETTIGSEAISDAIRDARLDKNVKAIVLRVNSPGGSALASDIILREIILTEKTKPVVVSMGDVAASGGYYIACGATKIIAQHTTITGSIGVFGVLFNLDKFFKNKLGVTFDVVKTNEYADMPTITRALTPFEKNILQQSIEEIYDTFIMHVAKGRNLSKEQVDKIAQGRVWSGAEALENGLVDALGGIEEAILMSAELAEIQEYTIIELPEQKDIYEEIIKSFMNTRYSKLIEQKIMEHYPFLHPLNQIQSNEVFMTRLPFDFTIE